MSLINQMLEDLERRRQAPAPRLPAQLRALPAASRPAAWRWYWLAGGLLTALVVVALLGHQWRHRALAKAAPPAVPVARGPLSAVAAPAPEAVPAAPAMPAPKAPAPAAPVPAMAAAGIAQAAAARTEQPSQTVPQRAAGAAPGRRRLQVETPPAARPPGGRPAHVRRAAPGPAAESSAAAGLPVAPLAIKQVTPQQQADADYLRAVDLLQGGHLADAEKALQASLLIDTGNVRARQLLVNLALQAREYPHAEAILADGLRVHPGQLPFVIMLARLQMERQAPAEALATLARASAAGAGNAEYLAFRATVLQALGRQPEAIRFYRQALARAPQAGAWWMGLGISLQANREYAEARQAYLTARQSGALSADLVAFVDQKLRQFPR